MEGYLSKELVKCSRAVSVEHYPRALEATVKSQQLELEASRQEIERERKYRVEAERREEETKTELINAQSTYALKLAEQRACHAEELEKKVEERSEISKEESRRHAQMATARCELLEKDLASTRTHLEKRQRAHDQRLEEDAEKHNFFVQESARKIRELDPSARHTKELRLLLAHRAHLQTQVSLLASALFVLVCCIVLFFSNKIKSSRIEEELLCLPSLHDLRDSVSEVLETHYLSVQISRVARLHEKTVNAIQACTS